MADKTLDTRGLNCPLPLIETRKMLKDVPVGGTLEVLATDPASELDFEVFCLRSGHELLEQGVQDGVYRFVLRRKR